MNLNSYESAYIDSSVTLRLLLGEPNPFLRLAKMKHLYSSEIMRVECFRTIDRLRILNSWPDEETSSRIKLLHQFLESVDEIPLQHRVLKKAQEPFPTIVRTLDALHLASALLIQEELNKKIIFITHDHKQALGAQGLGLGTVGFK